MKNNLISIIIPVYNVEQYLNRCIDSIVNQTYKNLEIILIDDGSTDNSGKICDEYALKDKRIKVIHKENGGLSSARNMGLKMVRGEYVGFIDPDDYIEPDMYQYLYELCQRHNVLLSMCNYTRVRDGVEKIQHPVTKEIILSCNEALERFHTELFSWNKLFHKTLIKDISFSIGITYGEDMIFCVQTFDKARQIVYGSEAKYNYIQRIGSASKQHFNIRQLTYFQAADYVYNYANQHLLSWLKKDILRQNCGLAISYLHQIVKFSFKDKIIINELLHRVRCGIIPHLFSHRKISHKIFGLMCCINFSLASKIYRLMLKLKVIR